MGLKLYEHQYIYWPELLWSKAELFKRVVTFDDEKRNNCDSLGFERLKLEQRDPNWKSLQIPVDLDMSTPNCELAYKDNLSYVRGIAEICQKKGIRFILVQTPYYETARNAISKDEYALIDKFINDVNNGLHSVEFKNYMYDNRFVEEDFFNASHLNEIGAYKFGKILENDFLAKVQ